MADTPFVAKTDPWGLTGSGKVLELVAVSDNKSASVAEAKNENGDTVAWHMYGIQYAPTYDYRVAGSGDITIPVFGDPVTTTMADGTSVKLLATNWTLSTSANGETTFSLTAESIPASVTAICPYQIDCGDVEVGPCQHAKLLFDCGTLGGTGCYLQAATYNGTCTLGKPTKNGDAIAAAVTDGRITAALTIIQTGSTIPSITAGNDWNVTAPLTCTNPDAEYPTWTTTLTMYLTAEDAS